MRDPYKFKPNDGTSECEEPTKIELHIKGLEHEYIK